MCWPLIFIGGFFILSGNGVYLYMGFINQRNKIYLGNTIAILWGGIIAAGLANFSFYLGAMLIFSDDHIPKAQLFISGVMLFFGPITSSFTGGYITARTGINKEKLIAALSGIIPLITLASNIDFSLNTLLVHPHVTLSLLLIVPCAWLGGYAFTKYKI